METSSVIYHHSNKNRVVFSDEVNPTTRLPQSKGIVVLRPTITCGLPFRLDFNLLYDTFISLFRKCQEEELKKQLYFK